MIDFKLEAICRYGNMKYCELLLKDGMRLTYVPIPENIRYALKSIDRFLKTEDGQKQIEDFIKNNCTR